MEAAEDVDDVKKKFTQKAVEMMELSWFKNWASFSISKSKMATSYGGHVGFTKIDITLVCFEINGWTFFSKLSTNLAGPDDGSVLICYCEPLVLF